MSAPAPFAPGSRYRFVVNSSEEAVRLIHEKFGGNARVVSVKQASGRGLARLLTAPKLEIIAEVTAPDTAEAPAQAVPSDAAPSASPEPEPIPHAEAEPVFVEPHLDEPLERILLRAGLTPRLMARLQTAERWPKIVHRPIREALNEVVELLHKNWTEQAQRPIGHRLAFFGSPGSGITTALCKALTMDIFFRQQAACVLKLDGDQPNPTDGLAMFCEALNVQLLRSAEALGEVSREQRVYLDVPGIAVGDTGRWRETGRLLDEFFADTRILVLNAAYELPVLKRAIGQSALCGATHIAFTHLDEVQHWGKLWECMFGAGPKPLFFGCGQNVSGSLSDNVFSVLVEKTFGTGRASSRVNGA